MYNTREIIKSILVVNSNFHIKSEYKVSEDEPFIYLNKRGANILLSSVTVKDPQQTQPPIISKSYGVLGVLNFDDYYKFERIKVTTKTGVITGRPVQKPNKIYNTKTGVGLFGAPATDTSVGYLTIIDDETLSAITFLKSDVIQIESSFSESSQNDITIQLVDREPRTVTLSYTAVGGAHTLSQFSSFKCRKSNSTDDGSYVLDIEQGIYFQSPFEIHDVPVTFTSDFGAFKFSPVTISCPALTENKITVVKLDSVPASKTIMMKPDERSFREGYIFKNTSDLTLIPASDNSLSLLEPVGPQATGIFELCQPNHAECPVICVSKNVNSKSKVDTLKTIRNSAYYTWSKSINCQLCFTNLSNNEEYVVIKMISDHDKIVPVLPEQFDYLGLNQQKFKLYKILLQPNSYSEYTAGFNVFFKQMEFIEGSNSSDIKIDLDLDNQLSHSLQDSVNVTKNGEIDIYLFKEHTPLSNLLLTQLVTLKENYQRGAPAIKFGNQATLLNANKQTTGFGFGNSNRNTTNQNAFGNSNQSAFGNSSQNPFGNSNQNAFGSSNQSGFGSSNQSGFGGSTQNLFGPPSQSSFGSNQGGFASFKPSGFGNNQTSFGNPTTPSIDSAGLFGGPVSSQVVSTPPSGISGGSFQPQTTPSTPAPQFSTQTNIKPDTLNCDPNYVNQKISFEEQRINDLKNNVTASNLFGNPNTIVGEEQSSDATSNTPKENPFGTPNSN